MTVDTVDLGLPHLTVVETIGRGGFSVVYKAHDTKLNRHVAVKVLTTVVGQADLASFEQECQIHGPLSNHTNIVTIHDAGYTPSGNPYLVMEYLGAGSLSDLITAEGRIPWQRSIELMAPVCDAVSSAHRMGVLHRDIKPANILLAHDGPKLADFGIACVSDATSPQFAVSWLHAPPEAERNQRDERSDVYSLASTVYHLIAGHAPFERSSQDNLACLLRRIVEEPAPQLSPSIAPAWLNTLLHQALAKDPAARPATAADFGAALINGPALQSTTLAKAPRPPKQRRSKILPAAVAAGTLAAVGLVLSPAWATLAMSNGLGSASSNVNHATTSSTGSSTTSQTSTTTDPSTTTTETDSSGPSTGETTSSTTSPAGPSTPATPGEGSVDTTAPTPPAPADGQIPIVVGLTEGQAVERLSDDGFTSVAVVDEANSDIPVGDVISASPSAGSEVPLDTAVVLVVSSGPASVIVPNLIGLVGGAAVASASDSGLDPTVVFVNVADDDPNVGLVTGQDRAAGATTPAGSPITLIVARAQPFVTVTVPPVIAPAGAGIVTSTTPRFVGP